jgi:large subunit ribosomal protein L7/L12
MAPVPDQLVVEAAMDPARLDPLARSTPVKCRLTLSLSRPDGELVAGDARVIVALNESVRPGLALKTSPDRKLLGPLGTQTDLAVGRIASGQQHSLLLQLGAPQRRAGQIELGRVEVLVEVSEPGRTRLRRETRIQAVYGEPELADAVTEAESGPVDERDEARLIDDFLEAYRRGSRQQGVETLRLLVSRRHDSRRRRLLEAMLDELQERGKLSKEQLDELSGRTGGGAKEASRFDVVLLDAGERPVKVAREIRAATGLGLRDVTDLMKHVGTTIGRALGFAQAGALQRRVQAAGARVEVRRVAESSE